MIKRRTAIAALTLSAAGLVAILADEDFVGTAMVPTKNDRPTVGFGSTFRDDGTPVRLGDTIKPVPALKRSLAHIGKDEDRLKQCVTAPLSQAEYDVMVDFSYQYGVPTTCASSMVRHANAGDYVASCNAYLLYKRSGGYDCSTLINGQPNKRCWGVWTRNVDRMNRCMGAGK